MLALTEAGCPPHSMSEDQGVYPGALPVARSDRRIVLVRCSNEASRLLPCQAALVTDNTTHEPFASRNCRRRCTHVACGSSTFLSRGAVLRYKRSLDGRALHQIRTPDPHARWRSPLHLRLYPYALIRAPPQNCAAPLTFPSSLDGPRDLPPIASAFPVRRHRRAALPLETRDKDCPRWHSSRLESSRCRP
jgi:hypothetical protein